MSEREAKALALLRTLEWYDGYFCPVCDGLRPKPFMYKRGNMKDLKKRWEDQPVGHRPDCQLAALLAGGNEDA